MSFSPPHKLKNIPEKAQWLGGVGAGSWFYIEKKDENYEISRFSPKGDLECRGVFKTEDSYILSLVAGDQKCSLNKLKKILNTKNISMANPEEVKTHTGYTIGSVSPVGHLNKVKI